MKVYDWYFISDVSMTYKYSRILALTLALITSILETKVHPCFCNTPMLSTVVMIV